MIALVFICKPWHSGGGNHWSISLCQGSDNNNYQRIDWLHSHKPPHILTSYIEVSRLLNNGQWEVLDTNMVLSSISNYDIHHHQKQIEQQIINLILNLLTVPLLKPIEGLHACESWILI